MKKYFLLLFVCLFIFGCNKPQYKIKKRDTQQIVIDSNIGFDSTYRNFIKPFKKQLEAEVNRIISYTPIDLTRNSGVLESNLGNLYADICYDAILPLFKKESGEKIDMALFNYGGIRALIPKGNISVKQIFNLMPFENKLVVVTLSGDKMQELFMYLAKANRAHPVSHVKLLLEDGVLKKPIINGKKFNINKDYNILTHDYLQHGGDNMNFFKEPINLFTSNLKVRDALLASIEKIDTISIKLDGRFTRK